MDEAGYGPNLGPLVITVTLWERAGSSHFERNDALDFWSVFEEIVTQQASAVETKLHIADSKQVYTSSTGLHSLERSVLALLQLMGQTPQSFRELWSVLDATSYEKIDEQPWYRDSDLELPFAHSTECWSHLVSKWKEICEQNQLELKEMQSAIVSAKAFNQQLQSEGSKGLLLSRTSLQLASRVWNPDRNSNTILMADKHGGRNRYDFLIEEVLHGQMVLALEESQHRSAYRVGESELAFCTKAERYFPVAAASLISKYVRELAMELFNRYWLQYLPELKPTKGYPLDAKRFRKDIEKSQRDLQIPDELLWRSR